MVEDVMAATSLFLRADVLLDFPDISASHDDLIFPQCEIGLEFGRRHDRFPFGKSNTAPFLLLERRSWIG
ncbi:hypothetical protein [Fulvimarina sp. MAC8]|uniref:hypothetical protein n=1 Tax=Fulvimarina sp. MAC8 TaxID=3162874 RepID=UPI0032EAAE14